MTGFSFQKNNSEEFIFKFVMMKNHIPKRHIQSNAFDF